MEYEEGIIFRSTNFEMREKLLSKFIHAYFNINIGISLLELMLFKKFFFFVLSLILLIFFIAEFKVGNFLWFFLFEMRIVGNWEMMIWTFLQILILRFDDFAQGLLVQWALQTNKILNKSSCIVFRKIWENWE